MFRLVIISKDHNVPVTAALDKFVLHMKNWTQNTLLWSLWMDSLLTLTDWDMFLKKSTIHSVRFTFILQLEKKLLS